ncbi:D-2-hydroxyacid dehydrogenase [Amycolatopsis sp. MtRt-6]|uniref:D-2-hydroxyacid dehydrogenase n=1 Tax=Amycolatopsis sp. MtRt-6 TaxID=2792782 RepID=UPI001F5DBAC7|nr:D-2-hydroxyacid dehydrogenase [Amycolatopsis sp. MtRt-6]
MCVFHPRLGAELGARVRAAVPGLTVDVAAAEPAEVAGYEILVANTFPAGMLARCRALRWLQLTSTGTDQLIGESPPEGVRVTHAGTVPARAVAEFVMMALLSLAKDSATLVRQQDSGIWRVPDTRLLAGSTLVQVGLGRIGALVADRARAFGVRVIGVTRSGRRGPADLVAGPDELVDVAREADNLVIAVPGTEQTRGLVGARVIAAMPAGACLVNVARASVLDTGAVVSALTAGRLRGALLDVHETEPIPSESPLWSVPGLWVTPHTAFAYPGEAADLAELVVDNVRRFTEGRPLRNIAAGWRRPDDV